MRTWPTPLTGFHVFSFGVYLVLLGFAICSRSLVRVRETEAERETGKKTKIEKYLKKQNKTKNETKQSKPGNGERNLGASHWKKNTNLIPIDHHHSSCICHVSGSSVWGWKAKKKIKKKQLFSFLFLVFASDFLVCRRSFPTENERTTR